MKENHQQALSLAMDELKSLRDDREFIIDHSWRIHALIDSGLLSVNEFANQYKNLESIYRSLRKSMKVMRLLKTTIKHSKHAIMMQDLKSYLKTSNIFSPQEVMHDIKQIEASAKRSK